MNAINAKPNATGELSRELAITLYKNKTAPSPFKTGRKDWTSFLLQLFQFRDVRDAKDGLAFSMVELQAGAARASKNVTTVSALVFDIDGTALEAVRDSIAPYEWVAHSTQSHTLEDPHYRLIFPLTRDVTPVEFGKLWNHVNDSLLGGEADKQCRDVGRLYFLPSCPTGTHAHAFTTHNQGDWLNPDATPPEAHVPGEVSSHLPDFGTNIPAPSIERSFEQLSDVERSRILDALQFLRDTQVNGLRWIDPYGNWIKSGMALHASYEKKDNALAAWKKMSSASTFWLAEPGAAEIECDEKWKTFGHYSGSLVTLNSLVYEAQQLGWRAPPTESSSHQQSRIKLKTAEQVLQQPYPRWLVRGVLQERSLTVVYGSANAGKSFLVLDIGIAVARGIPWLGHNTLSGVVVYLAIEGSQRNRLDAYRKHHQLTQMPGEFRVVDVPLNLRDRPVNGATSNAMPTDTELLIEEIRAQLGNVSISLIIVDTLNQALQGGEENSSVDMGAFIANANALRDALDCAVIVIHHAGKDQSKGARGHSSLHAAIDTEIEVINDQTNRVRIARVTKQREGRVDLEIPYVLQSVDLGPDPDQPNEQITSCVVAPVPLTMNLLPRGPATPTGSNQVPTWQTFRSLLSSSPTTSASGKLGVLERDLIGAVVKALPIKPGGRDRRRQQASEAIKGLCAHQWLEVLDDGSGRFVVPGLRAQGPAHI